MSQGWTVPVLAADSVSTALLTKFNDAVEANRTLHSGGTEPTNTVPYMWWLDTTALVLKQRNSADDAWTTVLAPNVRNNAFCKAIRIGGLPATAKFFLGTFNEAVTIDEVVICSSIATAGSTGVNNWAVQIHNLDTTLDLRATPWDTFTDAEIAGGAATVIATDQNADIAKDDLIEIQITKNGAPTDLTSAEITLELRGEIRGA